MEKYTPEQLAQLQLDAYSGKKLDEFIDVYINDVIVMEFGTNKIILEGKEAMYSFVSTHLSMLFTKFFPIL